MRLFWTVFGLPLTGANVFLGMDVGYILNPACKDNMSGRVLARQTCLSEVKQLEAVHVRYLMQVTKD